MSTATKPSSEEQFPSRTELGPPLMVTQPVVFGLTRLGAALRQAQAELPTHRQHLADITRDFKEDQALVRTTIGLGDGTTSISRAHALRHDTAAIPAKFRMNVWIVAPRPVVEDLAETPDENIDDNESEDE